MRVNFKNSIKKISVISIITITILMILVLIYLFSCTAAVDIGKASRILQSFGITWPAGFYYNCKSNEPVIVTINALDQNGEVFDSWSGDVNIRCTNVNVSVNPSTAPVTNGSAEIAIIFESITGDVEQVQIEISYEDVVVEVADVILVGLLAPTGVLATDGLVKDYVLIKWDAMAYAESYEVYKSISVGGPYSYLTDTTLLTHQDSNCLSGTTYYYKVRAYLGTYYNYSDFSNFDSGYIKNQVFILTWGMVGTGDGEFDGTSDVAVDSDKNVYVSDSGNNRIQKFDSSGTFLGWWGKDDMGGIRWHASGSGRTGVSGTGDGEFYGPGGIAVDSSGNVYVVDTANYRIQKFNSSGTFLGWWGKDDLGSTGWHEPGTGRTGVSGVGDGEFDEPSGLAVDSAGNVYVVDTANYRIQKFNSSGTFLGWWGKDDLGSTGWHEPGSGRTGVSGFEDGQLREPRDIAVDSSGNVFVVDRFRRLIQKFDSNGGFITKWGSNGSGDGQFSYPYGVGVDSSGNVYVADTFNDRIQKFDSNGVFLTKWGSSGTEEGQFNGPRRVAIDSDENIYVADAGNDRIQKLGLSGGFLGWWGRDDLGGIGWHAPGTGRTSVSGTGDGEFYHPSGVAVDSAGNVYIADDSICRIQKFNSSGTFLGWWGRDDLGGTGWHDPGTGRTGVSGTGDGQFDKPIDLAVDSAKNVYVADMGNHRIQKFDSSGTFLGWWGRDDLGGNGWHAPGTGRTGVYGSGDGEFYSPVGITVDSAENVYVVDFGNSRIQKFDSSGGFLTKWGSYGTGDEQFNFATYIAVNSAGSVYVADSWNHRIQKFDSSGALLGWWGRDDLGGTGWHAPGTGRTGVSGTGDGEFDEPSGLAVDLAGNVYAADNANSRIQKFDLNGSFQAKWGSFGPGDGQFNSPLGVVVDFNGRVYISDSINYRIQKYY